MIYARLIGLIRNGLRFLPPPNQSCFQVFITSNGQVKFRGKNNFSQPFLWTHKIHFFTRDYILTCLLSYKFEMSDVFFLSLNAVHVLSSLLLRVHHFYILATAFTRYLQNIIIMFYYARRVVFAFYDEHLLSLLLFLSFYFFIFFFFAHVRLQWPLFNAAAFGGERYLDTLVCVSARAYNSHKQIRSEFIFIIAFSFFFFFFENCLVL